MRSVNLLPNEGIVAQFDSVRCESPDFKGCESGELTFTTMSLIFSYTQVKVFGKDIEHTFLWALHDIKVVDGRPQLIIDKGDAHQCDILLRKGKAVEIMANYEPSLHYVSEWWKQLFGESEGKDKKGIFPASVDLTTDLHSMGQFIQDGSRIMFETVMEVEEPTEQITIGEEPVDLDGLNYLAGKTMDFVNKSAMNGTILAHTDGQVPNLKVTIPAQDEKSLGQLFYMYEFACGVSGYILGVNPFNQPGVESYKKNMFALLGKPGYEKEREELLKRL